MKSPIIVLERSVTAESVLPKEISLNNSYFNFDLYTPGNLEESVRIRLNQSFELHSVIHGQTMKAPAKYVLLSDSQGFYIRNMNPHAASNPETMYPELIVGYSRYAVQMKSMNKAKTERYTTVHLSLLNPFHTVTNVVMQPVMVEDGGTSIRVPTVAGLQSEEWQQERIRAEKWLRETGILQQYEEARVAMEQYGWVDVVAAEKGTNTTIAISYGCRVYAETARGLQSALMAMGYPYVFILPGVTMDYDIALSTYALHRRSEGRSGAAEGMKVLHIAIGPMEVAMLLRNYVAIQLEQMWSPYFNSMFTRYGRILRGAVGVWTFSERLSAAMETKGIANVKTIPLYTDTLRYRKLREEELRSPTTKRIHGLLFGSSSMRRKDLLLKMFSILSSHMNHDVLPLDGNGKQVTLVENRVWFLSKVPVVLAYAMGSWNMTIFDDDRDFVMRRTACLLNIHTDENSSLEVHRINYALSVGRCVLSERSTTDPALDERYAWDRYYYEESACDLNHCPLHRNMSAVGKGAVLFTHDLTSMLSVLRELVTHRPEVWLELQADAAEFYERMVVQESGSLRVAIAAAIDAMT